MNEVSCRANRVLLDAVASFGVDVEPLVEGLAVSRAHLVDPFRRIDWAVYVEMLDRLDRKLASPWALMRVGALTINSSGGELLRRLSGQVVSAKELHRAAMRWVAPSMFAHLEFRFEDLGGKRIRLICRIPDEHVGSRAFFYVSAGAVSHATELLGLPSASLEHDIDDRRGVFDMTLPAERSLVSSLRRRANALLRPSAFFEDLEAREATMRASYEALARSRSDFRRVLDRMPLGVVVHREGTIVYANEIIARIGGYDSPDEVIGRSVLSFLHPDEQATASARMAVPPAEDATAVVHRVVRRDGVVLPCELMPAQEIQLDGAPARLVVVRDLSESRRQEEQMILADRMAAVGALAASVAHEINNPLAYASTSLEIVERAASTHPSPPEALTYALATARDGLERVRAIVADLKTLSRPDEERRDPVDVHQVLDSTLRLAARELERRATITRQYGCALPARGSAQRLGQVFLNLLLNAAEAIPEGDDSARHEIRVTTFVDDTGRVVIEIGDTGGGVPSDVAPRIFEPFFTTKPVGRGTGLGLSICHRIVERLSGEITMRSLAPHGEDEHGPRELRTVFSIALPASEAMPSDQAPPLSGVTLTRGRVLVIDDEEALLLSLRASLAPQHDVTLASSGERALSILRAGATFDLILCDVMMPGRSGIDVYEAIRREHATLAERVVFMTGGAYTPAVRNFLAAMPSRHLEKPFPTSEIQRLLARRLRQASLRRRSAVTRAFALDRNSWKQRCDA